jgi:hypothetical protein
MKRRSLLLRGSTEVGAEWARLTCEALTAQGRSVAGGWPGTVVEARARVAHHLDRQLAANGKSPLTGDELDVAANRTYERAKGDWSTVERRTRRRVAPLAARRA